MPILMRYVRSTGVFITGGATLKGYQGWIELTSLSYGFSRSSIQPVVNKEFIVTKEQDVATGALNAELVRGKAAFVAIHELTSPPAKVAVLKFQLTGTVISALKMGRTTGHGPPIETWTLLAGQATWSETH